MCQRLNPALPDPVTHRYLEVLDAGLGQNLFCGTGAYPSSGSGVVIHPEQVDQHPPSFAFIDPSGQQIGSHQESSLETFEVRVFSQPTGFAFFEPFIGGTGDYPLIFLDDHGQERASFQRGLAPYPFSGGAVGLVSTALNDSACDLSAHPFADHVFVQRFSPTGTPVLPDRTDLGCVDSLQGTAMAENASSNVLLLLFRAEPHPGWDGYWLDGDLRLVRKFTTPELDSDPARVGGDGAVAALLDGSFVIRIGDQWKYRIQPGATSVEPAPCWLSARPGTTLLITRSRSAYALGPRQPGTCEDALEVLTPEGASCGNVGPLGEPAEECGVAIGMDGTLTRSAYALDAGPGRPATCVLKFWPEALGPTGL